MAFSGPVEDRLAIRELYGAYASAAMTQDRDAYLSFWAEDGIRADARGEAVGKAAIAAQWDSVWSMVAQMGFFSEVQSIVVTGDTAAASIFCREIVAFRDRPVWKLIGHYRDRLVRADDGWRFARRDYRIVFSEGAA